MTLWIQGHDRHARSAIRAFLEDQVTSKAARASKMIRSMSISIRDVNGPRGGVDHLIRVVVRTASTGTIVVRHRTSDVYAGVPLAIERAIHAARRMVRRRRRNLRKSHRRNLAESVQDHRH